MKINSLITISALLVFGQGAWAQEPEPRPHFVTNPGEEEGTEDLPFLINSITDLNYLAEDIKNGVPKDKDGYSTGYSGVYFKLTSDLDFSESTFSPIGFGDELEGASFKGIFDGDNHIIRGINYSDEEGVGIGLFGYISNPAKISNIVLDNCLFFGNSQVGAIVGSGNGSSKEKWGISNCIVKKDVTVEADVFTIGDDVFPGSYAGGIIGFCGCLTVENCYSEALVIGVQYVGAIAGYLMGNKAGGEGIIEDCYFTNNNKVVGGRGTDDEMVAEATNGILKITLLDKDDDEIKNLTRIKNYDSQECNVTLSGRTLYKDNSWNTLCLPFDASLTGDFSEAEIRTLSSADFTSGTLTLNFTPAVTSIEAGKPYIIKWTSGDNFTPTFTGVTIKSNAPSDATYDAANFHGIYTPYTTEGEDKSLLYLGANNTLYYPSAAMTINAFRAYFQLNNGITAGGETEEDPTNTETTSKTIRAFQLNLGDEETGIISVNDSGLMVNGSESWYSIDGRRLSGQPTAKGLYINKGKKILMK